jgi:hypothetical protein
MHAVSLSIEVNPSGVAAVLTREQLWRGLVIKAENPMEFIPGLESSRILERFPDGSFMREIVLRGQAIKEHITFTEPVQVHFLRVDTPDSGWITNIASESKHGLLLTFTFALNYAGTKPGSEEERMRGNSLIDHYQATIARTLAATRKLVQAGGI